MADKSARVRRTDFLRGNFEIRVLLLRTISCCRRARSHRIVRFALAIAERELDTGKRDLDGHAGQRRPRHVNAQPARARQVGGRDSK